MLFVLLSLSLPPPLSLSLTLSLAAPPVLSLSFGLSLISSLNFYLNLIAI